MFDSIKSVLECIVEKTDLKDTVNLGIVTIGCLVLAKLVTQGSNTTSESSEG